MNYVIKPSSVHPIGTHTHGKWATARIEGLKYPDVCIIWLSIKPGEDVEIHPGLDHALTDDEQLAKAMLSQLYDLWQLEQGANLRDGDIIELDGLGWKYLVTGVHVVPVVNSFPEGLWTRADEETTRQVRERNSYLFG